MMRPLRLYLPPLFLCLFFHLTPAVCETDFRIAAKKTLEIEDGKGQIKYLYFTFTFVPNFNQNALTDIFYKIEFNEIGTNYNKEWVNLYDGHLINLDQNGINYQWKGPFQGLQDIKYKFYLELYEDKRSTTERSVLVCIFSTDPQKDAEYYNSFFKEPFTVTATYYDIKTAKNSLQVYTILSAIKTGYKITKGIANKVNPYILVLSEVGDALVDYVIVYEITNYIESLPIEITLTCNNCGKTNIIERNHFGKFVFTCSGCNNVATIKVTE